MSATDLSFGEISGGVESQARLEAAGSLLKCSPEIRRALSQLPDQRRLTATAVYGGFCSHHDKSDGNEDDRDLALLAGDRLYADALSALAANGDLETLAVLADAIARSSQLTAEGDEDLTDQHWLRTFERIEGDIANTGPDQLDDGPPQDGESPECYLKAAEVSG